MSSSDVFGVAVGSVGASDDSVSVAVGWIGVSDGEEFSVGVDSVYVGIGWVVRWSDCVSGVCVAVAVVGK